MFASILVGILAILAGEAVYVNTPEPGLGLVAAGMLLSGLALAEEYRRVGTPLAKIAAAITFAFSLTAAGAPSYQAFRLMSGQAFLPQLMIGFMLFAVALGIGSLMLHRARILPTSGAILVPAAFVAWLILSTIYPVWGGIVGGVGYGAALLYEVQRIQRDRTAPRRAIA